MNSRMTYLVLRRSLVAYAARRSGKPSRLTLAETGCFRHGCRPARAMARSDGFNTGSILGEFGREAALAPALKE